jgi:hypothetical protein
MLKKRHKERLKELKSPGAPSQEVGAPGSIEQQLDMVEHGSLRGDEILHHHGVVEEDHPLAHVPAVDELLDRYQMDFSEENREGAEASGDEHSAGLQGGEPELDGQPHINTGLPGALTRQQEWIEKQDWSEREELSEGVAKRMQQP